MSLIFGFIVGFILASYLFYNNISFAIKIYELIETQIKNIINKKNKKDNKSLENETKDTKLENEAKETENKEKE